MSADVRLRAASSLLKVSSGMFFFSSLNAVSSSESATTIFSSFALASRMSWVITCSSRFSLAVAASSSEIG